MTKKYPTSTTSRTLDPSTRGFTTVVGKHDKRITDADVNLIQDLQDFKRSKAVDNTIFSGALSLKPFGFEIYQENVFTIPAFDIMFNGEVVTIGGNHSSDPSLNRVTVPSPSFWSYGQADDPAAIYVVYVELWYRSLNPEDVAGNSGYYIDSSGIRYIYPNGCIDCAIQDLIPDDVLDPFQGLNTTSRAQIQWAIRVKRVPVNYDFSIRRYGLDPVGDSSDVLFGRAYLDTPPGITNQFKFINMGNINGDYGLWRAGDGSETPVLPTMDGYTYATPVALVFQRNSGVFDPTNNPHGSADSSAPYSGTISSGISGRLDYRYCDVVYPEDVVDTRMTVSMTGYDWTKLLKTGFVDLINGSLTSKIGRGESPGSDSITLGSTLPYTVTIGQNPIVNTDNLGAFDGFFNGFGSDARTFYAVKAISVNQKSLGVKGIRWSNGDAITIDLDNAGARLGAAISYILVQALVQQPDGVSVKPVLFLSGQVSVTGLGTRSATIKIIRDLAGTTFDPGMKDLYVTVGVAYESGSSFSLKKIASSMAGGRLYDATINKDFRVFGVSEYTTNHVIADQNKKMIVVNPQYSNKVFGTRVEFLMRQTDGVIGNYMGIGVLKFSLPRTGINQRYDGLYIIGAYDPITLQVFKIEYSATDPGYMYASLSGIPTTTAQIVFMVLLNQTAQLSYNSSVKAVTAIDETITFGNYNSSTSLSMDPRIKLISQSKNVSNGVNTLVYATSGASLVGVGGTQNNKYIFVADDPSHPETFKTYSLLDVQFFNGVTTITVPAEADVKSYPYFMVGSLQPAFSADSSLALTLYYSPYQGDGDVTHTYSVLHSEETALITTNGTGAAPIVGLKDIYPYNRELPIVTTLPAQPTWNESELANQAVSNYFDSNYEAKRFNNVEHTFITPTHSNDFIEPVGGWKRKKLKFSFPSGRGFAKISPHIGFAIRAPKPKAVLGDNIVSSSAPIYLFVNNVHGSDSLDGLTAQTSKLTIQAAVAALPPILRHPCFIYLADTGVAYKLKDVKNTMVRVYLGDGDTQSIVNYCLAGLAHTLQDAGRLTIARMPGAVNYPEISAEGFTGFGDGPSSAFVVTDTRAVFQGIKFSNFTNPAIYAIDSYVDFIDCQWWNCFISGSFVDGTSVSVSRCSLALTNSGTGFILEDSSLTASSNQLVVNGGNINAFYVCERTSNLTLDNHVATDDLGMTGATSVVLAKLNSTVVCNKNYTSVGKATLTSNSVLTRTTKITPFAGGVSTDTSSMVMTDIS